MSWKGELPVHTVESIEVLFGKPRVGVRVVVRGKLSAIWYIPIRLLSARNQLYPSVVVCVFIGASCCCGVESESAGPNDPRSVSGGAVGPLATLPPPPPSPPIMETTSSILFSACRPHGNPELGHSRPTRTAFVYNNGYLLALNQMC